MRPGASVALPHPISLTGPALRPLNHEGDDTGLDIPRDTGGDGERRSADSSGSPRCFLILTGAREARAGGVERQTQGSAFVALGGLFAGRKVGWLVMREDSWQVQQRLTAKCGWQRGKTTELSEKLSVLVV